MTTTFPVLTIIHLYPHVYEFHIWSQKIRIREVKNVSVLLNRISTFGQCMLIPDSSTEAQKFHVLCIHVYLTSSMQFIEITAQMSHHIYSQLSIEDRSSG